ncbi:MAG TPA: DUF6701 domain-containing protein [Telluria sp.]|nr:DUF6701 domain-containing protein [Telluria sp.]
MQLPLCYPNGAVAPVGNAAWSGPYTFTFPGKSPSVGPYAFQYKDVGSISLSLQEKSGNTYYYGRAAIVSQPAALKLDVTRPSDGLVNPGSATTGFVAAGEPFKVTVTGVNVDNTAAPNFGKETVPEDVKLEFVASGVAGELAGAFGAASGGAYTGTFTYSEGGTIVLGASMNAENADYLGSSRRVGNSPMTVGMFFPAYFTTAPTAAFDCQPLMACPTGATSNGDDLGVSGGVYSAQPFDVTVTAFSANGKEMMNYTPTATYPMTLTAYGLPGQGAPAPVEGVLTNRTGASLALKPTFTLSTPYSSGAPAGTSNWSLPRTIYLRAEAKVLVAGSPAASERLVTSLRAAGTPSVEGGVRVLTGRLFVANSAGSELLRLPVRLNAQYWTGSGWANNIGDNVSAIAASASYAPVFSNCRQRICNTAVVAQPWNTLLLDDGAARIWLQPPGAGFTGSIDLRIHDSGRPAWLPSTVGRAVFGSYRSPLIYIREVY